MLCKSLAILLTADELKYCRKQLIHLRNEQLSGACLHYQQTPQNQQLSTSAVMKYSKNLNITENTWKIKKVQQTLT